MWFRYNDVISAVHGSKGVLFFETPPNVRVTDNWTGLPGAHCRPNKEHFQKKISIVFGCGGERDKYKRIF